MESNQNNPFLNYAFFFQGKGIEELRQTLLLTVMELENTKIKAQEELKMRDDELIHLKELLNTAMKERDEAQEKAQRMVFESLLLQQHQIVQLQNQQSGQFSGVSSIEDEPIREKDSNNGFTTSDCDESIVSSVLDSVLPQKTIAETDNNLFPIVPTKPLPEKGKLLQAVVKAGPLLQTLLLAGPLPQWRHPPPPLDTYEIPPPPVTIPSPISPQPPLLSTLLPIHSLIGDTLLKMNSGSTSINNCSVLNRKRGLNEDLDYLTEPKFRKVVMQ
ncbi:hypothetical protein Leryth_013878 [Lithospermum erythrorhizon]|uniref:Uncharacterized protein n=1 Tax=Lithospermum erythrorhizon TaxID=34254 RepID=A0AAV3Q1A5_LITER|nr:hypothetical protein Leryth_013878 [Lithospermum erythrorhizon]